MSTEVIRNDSEIELAVLGVILENPSLLNECDLTVHHFVIPNNKIIFKAILETANKGIAIDYITVTETLIQLDKIETVGGTKFIDKLSKHMPTFENFKSHIVILKERYIERKGYEIAGKLQRGEITVDQATEQLNKLRNDTVDELPDVREDLSNFLEFLTTDNNGIETKFTDFDEITDGLHGGELVILGARPAMGKTSFALNLASNILKSDINPNGAIVAFFSLEMGKNPLYSRIMSMETGIDSTKIRKAKKRFVDEDWRKASLFMGNFSNTNFYPFMDVNHLNDILRKIRAIRTKHKDEDVVIIIDHIGLVGGTDGLNRNDLMGEISRKLKLISMELNINIFALSQLSRGVEHRQEKRPVLADLRESGNIEQDADLVAFLYREDYYKPASEHTNISELIISKHRNGACGIVQLYFQNDTTRFINIPKKKGEKK